MRAFTTYLRTHYIHQSGDGNEWGLFGNGLFPSMGIDEVYQPFEGLATANVDELRSHGPYDLAFFMPYLDVPAWIREVVGPNCPIICWIADDVWRFDFTREIIAARAADHFITTAESALPRYFLEGVKADRVTLSTFGTRADWWPRLVTRPETPEAKAVCTGLLYGDRMARLQAIADAADESGNVAVDVWDTQRDVLPLAAYHQQMADAAFTLALTKSSHGLRQMKARLFEPQIHGSILVTEDTPRLSDYWTAGEDCIVFATPQEAQEQMRYLLAHPAAYQEMSQKAYRRVLAEHSYQARFGEVLDTLGLPYTMPDFSALADVSHDDEVVSL